MSFPFTNIKVSKNEIIFLSLDVFMTFLGMFLLGYWVYYLNQKYRNEEVDGNRREFYFKNALFVAMSFGWIMMIFAIVENILITVMGLVAWKKFEQGPWFYLKIL